MFYLCRYRLFLRGTNYNIIMIDIKGQKIDDKEMKELSINSHQISYQQIQCSLILITQLNIPFHQ
jgi:hypothetical protein